MTDFITKPSQKTKTVAKVAGGGLTAGTVVFMYFTFVPKSDLEAFERRADKAHREVMQFQRETWQRTMDLHLAVEANRASLDMLIRLRAESVSTNHVATN